MFFDPYRPTAPTRASRRCWRKWIWR